MNLLNFLKIDVITSLLSGRLVRERIGPAMLSAVQSQVLYISDTSYVKPYTDDDFLNLYLLMISMCLIRWVLLK